MNYIQKHFGPIFLILIFFFLVWISKDYGITWDEPVQQTYGNYVYNYFASGFEDLSSFSYINLYLYGGMFDLVCVLIQKSFGLIDSYGVRHMVNAAFGWIGIVYVYKFANKLGGLKAGLFSIIMMLCLPQYFGHMMNNPKDIPFASFYMMALYYLLNFAHEFEKLKFMSILKLICSMALAINARVGGIILLLYFELLIFCFYFFKLFFKQTSIFENFRRNLTLVILVPILVIPLGTLFWPWALHAPFLRPFEALKAMSHFVQEGRTIFDGYYIDILRLPWNYVPKLFIFTTPLVVFVGVGFAFFCFCFQKRLRFPLLGLWFAVIFPLVYVIVSNPTMYDGIRHLLFVFPPLVVVSALGFNFFYEFVQKFEIKYLKYLPLMVFAYFLSEPLFYSLRNHPNEVVYFNPLVNGTSGAFLKYDLDYWGNCQKQALSWIAEQANAKPYVVEFGASLPHANFTYLEKPLKNVKFIGDNESGHYFLQTMRGDPIFLQKLLDEKKIVYKVTADEAPLCIIWEGAKVKEPVLAFSNFIKVMMAIGLLFVFGLLMRIKGWRISSLLFGFRSSLAEANSGPGPPRALICIQPLIRIVNSWCKKISG